MNISYQNLGNEITLQQANVLDTYEKHFRLENGLVKKKELFMDGQIYNIHYYRDENETEDDAIQLLSHLSSSYQIYITEGYGNFIIEYANVYLKNQITAKIRNILDQNFETICFQELDLSTGNPVLEETIKYLGHYKDEKNTHYCN